MAINYQQQIKSPEWQKKRLQILNRDEFTCQNCGETKLQLHVHHKKYLKGKMIWDYPNWILVTLCENCHSEHHESKKTKINIEPEIPKKLQFIESQFDEFEKKNKIEIYYLFDEFLNYKGNIEKFFDFIFEKVRIENLEIDREMLSSKLERIRDHAVKNGWEIEPINNSELYPF